MSHSLHFLITAGPTREPIDDVRFITNASSGRMGFAIAQAALDAGHRVTLLHGPVSLRAPEGCKVEAFSTVEQLGRQLGRHFDRCDVLVMAAAVGDFRVAEADAGKFSRKDGPRRLTLVPTEDLLAAVAKRKRAGQVLVAFAAETGTPEAMAAKARAERAAKGADLVVCNPASVMTAEAGEAAIFDADGEVLPWARRSKADLAGELVAAAARRAGR